VLKITIVHNALKSFLPLLQGKVVQVCCDNIVTMANLNHMGGRSPLMNCAMPATHQLCKPSHIQFMATYLLGADLLNYALATSTWKCYTSNLHQFKVDCFGQEVCKIMKPSLMEKCFILEWYV